MACVETLAGAVPPRLVPGLVVAEACYLLDRDAGAGVEAAFLRSFGTGFLRLVDVTAEDLERSAELVSGTPTCTSVARTPASLLSRNALG